MLLNDEQIWALYETTTPPFGGVNTTAMDLRLLRAQLREVLRQMTSGEHGIDMILGAPDGRVSFRWSREAWQKFEGECK